MADGNDNDEATVTTPETDFIQVTNNLIRDKILHTLAIWPKLSPSMIQVGIGTAISPRLWHPILENMIREKLVQRYTVRSKSPTGRDQSYTIIQLNEDKS
jgi:hypothetical protein